MPLEPQLELEDASLQRGQPMLSYIKRSEESRGVFRFVEVLTPADPDAVRFLRGDCNADGKVNISDATCALDRLFAGVAAPGCLAALDTNGDGDVNIADPVALLNFLFGGGPMISAPFPDCGPGMLPADPALGCEDAPNC